LAGPARGLLDVGIKLFAEPNTTAAVGQVNLGFQPLRVRFLDYLNSASTAFVPPLWRFFLPGNIHREIKPRGGTNESNSPLKALRTLGDLVVGLPQNSCPFRWLEPSVAIPSPLRVHPHSAQEPLLGESLLSKKPSAPYRSTLSPSSFYNIRCPRCLWLEYWHGMKFPTNLALQLLLSRLQENAYDGVSSDLISDTLPRGNVTKYKRRFTSQQIVINGETTRWKIYGEIDLLVTHEDNSFSIVDGKVSMKKDANSLIESYWTQLEAYVYALENPLDETPMLIRTIGLLQWRIDGSINLENSQRGFSVDHRYIPIPRRPQEFMEFLEKFVGIIEGEFPESGINCENCEFLSQIGVNYGRL